MLSTVNGIHFVHLRLAIVRSSVRPLTCDAVWRVKKALYRIFYIKKRKTNKKPENGPNEYTSGGIISNKLGRIMVNSKLHSLNLRKTSLSANSVNGRRSALGFHWRDS